MQLTVLQWNVWYQADIEHIVELLRRVDADVVCLQELTKNQEGQSHSDTIGYIAEKLGGYHHSSQPMIRDDVQRQLFNAIFSRYELTRTSSQWINTPIGIGGHSDEFRAYIEATIKVGDRSVRIGTAHMSYTDRFGVTDRNRNESDKLVAYLCDKPNLIFTGDLNAPPESYVVQQIQKHLDH
jgi:endonuclease/exonuclease/phosphatase family metal-dependent hydrolase